MNDSALEMMEQGLQMSRRLLVLMKEEAWDAAAELDSERLCTIQQALAAEPKQGIEGKIEILREIIALNTEMEAIGFEGKSQLSKQLRQIRQGRKVGKVYSQNC